MNKNAKFAFQATENLKPCFDYLQFKKKMKLVSLLNKVRKLVVKFVKML